ncbi:uncharacterized protein LOC106878303 isoform X1 [Argonauta hians]
MKLKVTSMFNCLNIIRVLLFILFTEDNFTCALSPSTTTTTTIPSPPPPPVASPLTTAPIPFIPSSSSSSLSSAIAVIKSRRYNDAGVLTKQTKRKTNARSRRRPRIGRIDCIVGHWSPWTLSGVFQVRFRSRIEKPRNGGLPCPPLVTARKLRHNGQLPIQLPFEEASRRFLSNVIRGGSLAADEAVRSGDKNHYSNNNTNSQTNQQVTNNQYDHTYTVKPRVWPERLLLTVLDDSLCVLGSTLGLKTKYLVLSVLESLCGTTLQQNAPTVGVQTYSIKSRLILPLKKAATKRQLRRAILSYYTNSIKLLQLDRALDRTVSILSSAKIKKKYWRSAVLLVLSSWNYCDENTLGEAVLIKEHSDVNVLLIGPEPDSTQIVCFSSLASQPVEEHYIRLPDSETLDKFLGSIFTAQLRNTFCYN